MLQEKEVRMGVIELPLAIKNNPIKAIQYFIPSIALTEKDSLPWVFNNYIQLEWVPNDCIRFGINNINFSYAEPVKTLIVSRRMIKDNNIDIINFIKTSIANKQYIQLTLDEYYIEGKNYYRKEHVLHDNLVYGVSDSRILLYGYGDTLKLKKSVVNYNDFLHAFYFNEKKVSYRDSSKTYAELIYVLSKIKSDYQTDILGIINQISDFLNGDSYAKRYRESRNLNPETVSGISIYDKLLEIYSETKNVIDMRNACVIRDHKNLMVKRIEFLQGYIFENYYSQLLKESRELEKKSEQLVLLSLKYNFTHDISIISRTKKIILEMHSLDDKFMKELLKAIHHNLDDSLQDDKPYL